MRMFFKKILNISVPVLLLMSGYAAACEPTQDGCLGCNDEQLPVCLNDLVGHICDATGTPARCDARRVYDDAERHVMINTGNQMSRIRSMERSARKYRLH